MVSCGDVSGPEEVCVCMLIRHLGSKGGKRKNYLNLRVKGGRSPGFRITRG